MKSFQKVVLLFLLPLFLSSCASQKKGPYKTTALTLLKSKEEIQSYRNKVSASVTTRNVEFTIDIVPNPDIYDYVVDEIKAIPEEQDDDKEKEAISSFLSTFYFITKEKLVLLFPVNSVSAGYVKQFYPRNQIYIKKYDSETDRKRQNYHYFVYSLWDNYLYLYSYSYCTFNRVNINHMRVSK